MKNVAISFSAIYVGVFTAFLFITHHFDGHNFGPRALDYAIVAMSWFLVATCAATIYWVFKKIDEEPTGELKKLEQPPNVRAAA